MSKKFFTDLKNIRAAIDTNKLVVFAGAGISIDAGVPGWNTLIEEMRLELEIPKNENDYLKIAQMYFNDRQQKEFIDKIRSVLKHKKIRYNEIHEQIFKLNPEHILTTNFDDLLEQVIKKRSLPFSVVSKDKQFPYALNTNLLVKVHGDLDETEIVLKEDDFINYSLNHPLIEAFIKSVFASKMVLLIGYGFSDIDLKMIIQTVRNILGKDFQNAYLLSVEEKLHPSQREYLKSKGVNVINYFDADYGNSNYITDFLKGNNALKEDHFKQGENLSPKGQNLLNFLRFISVYDKFNESIKDNNIIDKLYLSLNRFAEFKSLPPDFVVNLYPFNLSTKYVHSYEPQSLATKNNQINDLFFEQVEIKEGVIKFNPPKELNYTPKQIAEYETKLKVIISTLNYSAIGYLYKENEKPDSLGNFGWSDMHKRLLITPTQKCNCVNCSLRRLELRTILSYALNSTIDETTSIQSDLELAYANYKIGNFNNSFQLFEEAANKSWLAGKYFSYYIAKHNVKTLRILIRGYETNLRDETRTKILKELEDIDFDKLLFQIPFMGKNEYELLKYIRDDDILVRGSKEIDKIYKEIVDVYDRYKTGYKWTVGPYYPQTIELELYKIVSFYTNNYIIIDEFSEFKDVCKKGIEALLISYATSTEYNGRLTKFHKSFFEIVVLYGSAKEIKDLTEKYEINEIVFAEEDLPEILTSINNFLESFFEVNKFFGKNTNANKETRNQINNGFFEDQCRKKFCNIFLLLSGIELKKELTSTLISSLLYFFKHEVFLRWNEIDYFCAFVYKNYKLFASDDLILLLKSFLHKPSFFQNSRLLNVISYAFTKNDYQRISDNDLVFNILSLSKEADKNYDSIISLWAISNDFIKEKLISKIIEILNTEFNLNLYLKASYKNIIDFNLYFEQYLAHINHTKGNGHYILSAGRPKMENFVFTNAIFFIYKMQVKSDDNRLEKLTDLTQYMKFYLNPEAFDYGQFNVEWLYINDADIFFERFKKIPPIKEAIETALKSNFEKDLAEIYVKHFL